MFCYHDDDHPCNIEGIGTVLIKMFAEDGARIEGNGYVPQLKKNFISVGDLKVLVFEVSIRDDVFKMTRESMVILKGIRRNNLYNLNGSMVIGQVATSINSDNNCTRF